MPNAWIFTSHPDHLPTHDHVALRELPSVSVEGPFTNMVFITVPAFIAAVAIQKHFEAGLTGGAVK